MCIEKVGRAASAAFRVESNMRKFASTLAVAAATLALAACGGGGGSGTLTQTSGSGTGTGTGTGTNSTYSMGNGSGSSFQSGMIGISSANVSAGGTTSLSLSIVDQTGTLYTAGPVTITYSSTCIAQGLAVVTASGSSTAGTNANTVVTTTGTADATYTAKGCSGADVITASATVGSTSLTATGTVTVASSATGSIQFVSASPTTIGLKGTGQPSTSTVVFKVLDSSGAPKPGVVVNFTLNTSVGGLALTPTTATSAADGTVQTAVSSGTVHTVVTVTAAITSPALSTQSSDLTVTAGIPASAAFSIAVASAEYNGTSSSGAPACPNVEAYDTDGVVVPVTVRLSDRYGNPVLDNTSVTFYTNGGQIVGSCNTTNGACVADWTSANPRPQTTDDSPPILANGRATILAYAIGEESFTDEFGTGFYQSPDPFQDLGEPYDDANQNGVHDTEEWFYDYYHTGAYVGPSGSFIGITCNGTSASSTCTEKTLAIGASHLIIMSTAGAQIPRDSNNNPEISFTGFTLDSGTTPPREDIAPSGAGSITFTIADENGNPIAAGSSVTVTADAAVGTVSTSSSSFTEGCSTAVGGDTFTSYITGAPASTAGVGNITIQVKSAGTSTPSTFTIPAEAK